MFNKELFEKRELSKRGITGDVKTIFDNIIPEGLCLSLNEHNSEDINKIYNGGFMRYDDGNNCSTIVSSRKIKEQTVISFLVFDSGKLSRLITCADGKNVYRVLINDLNFIEEKDRCISEMYISKDMEAKTSLSVCFYKRNDTLLDEKNIFSCDVLEEIGILPEKSFLFEENSKECSIDELFAMYSSIKSSFATIFQLSMKKSCSNNKKSDNND